MNGKFAVLEYANAYSDFISGKALLAIGNKRLLNWYAAKKLPYKAFEFSVLETEGLKVVLPLTAADADTDANHKNKIYEGILKCIAADRGVTVIKPIRGSKYTYDDIITAASGFYILPFVLPLFIKKCAKNKDVGALELLIVDGLKDLTLDILCVISSEINNITVYTSEVEYFQKVSYRFYCDSGLNINVVNDKSSLFIKSADIVLNASSDSDQLTNLYKEGAVFLDMAGNSKKVADIAARRPGIVCADGLEFKKDGAYLDNILLEAVCLANVKGFSKCIFGGYDDDDFYGVLDYIESLDLRITTLLRGGKSV